MSAIFTCPSCKELSGYEVLETVDFIRNKDNGEMRSLDIVYIKCTRCGAIIRSPFDEEGNTYEEERAMYSLLYEKLS